MNESIADKISERHNTPNLVRLLSEELSGSELNSLLLEVFARRAGRISPAALLKNYEENRFVKPADCDAIKLLEASMLTLQVFVENNFTPVLLSPLAPLGTSSIVGPVHQDKIVSTLRNCEVLSDAANALALHIAALKKHRLHNKELKFGAVQRHVRSQPLTMKGFTPHFTIGCLVTSGTDTGNHEFELQTIVDHFRTLDNVLTTVFRTQTRYFKLLIREGYKDSRALVEQVAAFLKKETSYDVRIDHESRDNNYYIGLQFKCVIEVNGREIEIADGGNVNWTQRLLNDSKERFFISVFGLELLHKFEEGLI